MITDESVPKLIARMKAHESGLKREKGIGPDMALFTKGSRNQRAERRDNDQRSGQGTQGTNGSGSNRPPIECYYCKRVGHRYRECQQRIADEADMASGKSVEANPATSGTVVGVVAEDSMWLVNTVQKGGDQEVSHAIKEAVWTLDSGCTQHVSGNRSLFVSYKALHPGERRARLANNEAFDVAGLGDIEMQVWHPGLKQTRIVRVQSVLHVPECADNNLLSVSQLEHIGMHITFCGAEGVRITRDGRCLAEVARSGDMYVVRSTGAPMAEFKLKRKNAASSRAETVNLLRIYDERLPRSAAGSPAVVVTKLHHIGVTFGELGPIRPLAVEMPRLGEPAPGFKDRMRGLAELGIKAMEGRAWGSSGIVPEVTTTSLKWDQLHATMVDMGGTHWPGIGNVKMMDKGLQQYWPG